MTRHSQIGARVARAPKKLLTVDGRIKSRPRVHALFMTQILLTIAAADYRDKGNRILARHYAKASRELIAAFGRRI